MLMPGEHCKVRVLLRKPMVLHQGTRFVVRENRLTAVTGMVTEILKNTKQRIKGFNVTELQRGGKGGSNIGAVVEGGKKKK